MNWNHYESPLSYSWHHPFLLFLFSLYPSPINQSHALPVHSTIHRSHFEPSIFKVSHSPHKTQMKKRTYRITHTPPPTLHPTIPYYMPSLPIIVEGQARSPYHACKLAFKIMLREGHITQIPLFNQETEEFPNTTVEILPESPLPTDDPT